MDSSADLSADSPATDADLARAVAAGDMEALAVVYDRYADRLHDYCWSVLRDRDEAADAVQEVFITAARRLGQLREPDKLRAWLYAVARHESLRRADQRKRVTVTDDVPEAATADPSLDDAARRSELATLVWDAAAGLADRDRAILDLHLRQGLEGQELGDALGVSASHAYVLVSRLRDSVARSLGAFLVARLGSEDCDELATILQGWDGRFSPLIRKRVARHVDGCQVCDERRRTCASPLALLGAAPIVSAPALLRSRLFEQGGLVSGDKPLPPAQAAGWQDDGFPEGLDHRRRWIRGPRLAFVAAGLVVLLTGIAGAVDVVASASSGGTGPAAVSATRAPDSAAPSPTTSGTPTPTGSRNSGREMDTADGGNVPRLQLSPTPSPSGAGAASGSHSVVPNGSRAGAGGKSIAGGSQASQAPALSVSATPTSIETTGCKPSTSTVTLTITGGDQPSQVTLRASVPGSGSTTTSMAGGGGSGRWTYSATVGNAHKPGQLTYEATEVSGGRTGTSPSGAITVTACSAG